ncbi:hypothetical protein [Psychrobacter sp. DM4]
MASLYSAKVDIKDTATYADTAYISCHKQGVHEHSLEMIYCFDSNQMDF